MKQAYDIIVIGGGHAGAEAAWAASRLGASVALITLDPAKVGQMSCNPAIGGLAKGQMVREVDALGGLMGIASDNTGIQFRMLNRSKGPAVWGPRAQADKYKYAIEVQRLLGTCPHLDTLRGEVAEIEVDFERRDEGTEGRRDEDGGEDAFVGSAPRTDFPVSGAAVHDADGMPDLARLRFRTPDAPVRTESEKPLHPSCGEGKNVSDSSIAGSAPQTDSSSTGSPRSTTHRAVRAVILTDGTRLACRAVVIGSGTFLRGLMHTGEQKTEGGRVGEAAATGLSGCLARLGLELGRLKTGTPPRLARESIDFSRFEQQPGDESPLPFSYLNEYPAMVSGIDSGMGGPPMSSISDAADENHGRAAHATSWRPPLPQVHCWIGATNHEIHEIIRANLHRAPMYSGQIASTGPRYCPSIEDKVVRFADKLSHHIFLEPEGLDTNEIYCNGISTSLPADVQDKVIRLIPGLENAKVLRYGYAVEYDMVAAAQIHSTLETKSISGLFLAGQINGTSGYEEAAAQGLMAGINAYRHVTTGAADFVLRRDQAYIGVLIDDLVTKPPIEPYRMFTSRAEHRLHLRNDNADERLTAIGREIGLVDDDRWQRYSTRRTAIEEGMAMLRSTRQGETSAFELLRRPEITWSEVTAKFPALQAFTPDVGWQLEIRAKYEGYIAREQKQIERMANMEQKLIPPALDYAAVNGLRNEARQKLAKFTPRSLGQALRISGVTPADVTVLAIHLSRSTR